MVEWSWDPSSRPSWDSVRALRGSEFEPKGFREFWLETADSLATVDPTPRPETEVGDGAATKVTFDSFDGETIHAAFSPRPSGGTDRPLVITSHGYESVTDPERVRRLATLGLDVASFDVRGFGKSTSRLGRSADGYLLTGIESKEGSILRGAVMDFVQTMRAATSWFGQPTRLVFQGFSFAGGLATMAAGVLGLVEGRGGQELLGRPPGILAIGAPTFGQHQRRLQLSEWGSGRELADYVARHPERTAETLEVLSYFDAVHFAPFVEGRVIAGVGQFDPVVPAVTVYPILNALPSPPELFELPCSHTTRPEEQQWLRWESAWIRAAQGR